MGTHTNGPCSARTRMQLFRLCVFQAEEDLRQNKACHVHAVDQTVHTDEEKAIREVVDSVLWQMAADRKSTALKQLQGHMWRAAYVTGENQRRVSNLIFTSTNSPCVLSRTADLDAK